MKYNVYFELYGKKLKAVVEAPNRQAAIEAVKSKIIFHKVESFPDDNDIIDHFESLFGIKM